MHAEEREPFLGELPEEFLLERCGWSCFHSVGLRLSELMLSVVMWYLGRISRP